MQQNHDVLPVTVQFRETNARFIDALDISIVPRVGEQVHIQGDKLRTVVRVVHAFDPNEHIVLCYVTD